MVKRRGAGIGKLLNRTYLRAYEFQVYNQVVKRKLLVLVPCILLVLAAGLAFVPPDSSNPPVDMLTKDADEPICSEGSCVWRLAKSREVVQEEFIRTLTAPEWSFFQMDLAGGDWEDVFESNDWWIRIEAPAEGQEGTRVVTRRKGRLEKLNRWLEALT
jgi:hypothetical protein